MKEINLEEMKQIELKILIDIDRVCRENNIEYTLFGGTLIGAVRHKGFIPWDDDIDIAMTRKNYDKFLDIYISEKKHNFRILNFNNCKDYPFQFTKVVFSKSKIKEEKNKEISEMGIFVDIFPLDKISLKNINRKLKKQIFYSKIVYSMQFDDDYYAKKPLYKRIIRKILKMKNISYYINRLNKICKKENAKDCEYIGSLVGGQGMKDIWPINYFDEYIDLEFENKKFMSIKEYDKLLKHRFGEYMKYPPKE